MVKDSVSRGKRCIVVVRGRKLVDQASKRLFREGVNHGVLMASHWNYRPQAPVQVCSIDTLISRNLRPDADLIIIDEAHLFTPDSKAGLFFDQYPDAFFVAVTATPWTTKGLGHIAEEMVHPVTMNDLIEMGFLAPARYFAPSTPDLSSVKISSSTKDYVVDDLANVMIGNNLTGDVVAHWKNIADGKPTLCFAVNVKHSKILVERFLQAGIAAEHCDAETPDAGREEVIKRLESGETKVVCNVGIFCTGVDIPCLGAVIMARPTKSRNLYIQQAGRGTRPIYAEGADLSTTEGRRAAIKNGPKPSFILLDHAGNVARHDLPTDEPEVSLDGTFEEPKKRESKTCKNCFAIYRGPICPECGFVPPETAGPAAPEEVAGQLVEISGINPIKKELKRLQAEARLTGKKSAWAYYKLVDKFGLEDCKPFLPAWFIEKMENPSAHLFSSSRFKGYVK